ncbi:hypothetical protein M2M32_11775, partial [Weissella cibaria]|nr:hypothetical protein [Weissella cibaria]
LKKEGKTELNKNRRPALLTIPSHYYLAITGTGDPNTMNFGDHIAALYAIAYPIKMAYKKLLSLEAYMILDGVHVRLYYFIVVVKHKPWRFLAHRGRTKKWLLHWF